MKGQVIKLISGQYKIESENKFFIVKASGNLRFNKTPPIVGDFVEFEPDGFLTKIYERKNFLIRPKVANVDQIIVVMSLKEPDYSSFLLDKFLAIIESKDIHPVIFFTKKDLSTKSFLNEYISQGYEAYEFSNKNINKDTLINIKKIFKNKLTAFTGQTGAGKSTTINTITGLNLETNEISKSLGRGKHTTRVVQIYNFMEGKIIDTPGFSSLDFNLTKLELSRSWHDFRKLSSNCKFFRTCIHYKESECAIKKNVIDGKISEQRYNNYVKLLLETENNETNSSINFRKRK